LALARAQEVVAFIDLSDLSAASMSATGYVSLKWGEADVCGESALACPGIITQLGRS